MLSVLPQGLPPYIQACFIYLIFSNGIYHSTKIDYIILYYNIEFKRSLLKFSKIIKGRINL